MNGGLSINILVVDDDDSVRDSLVCYLEDNGHQVRAAESAEEALELLAEDSCDVAIVDLRLPVMDGESLVHKIHVDFPDIRFLIHTGSTDFRLTADLVGIGMKEEQIIYKPQIDMEAFEKQLKVIQHH